MEKSARRCGAPPGLASIGHEMWQKVEPAWIAARIAVLVITLQRPKLGALRSAAACDHWRMESGVVPRVDVDRTEGFAVDTVSGVKVAVPRRTRCGIRPRDLRCRPRFRWSIRAFATSWLRLSPRLRPSLRRPSLRQPSLHRRRRLHCPRRLCYRRIEQMHSMTRTQQHTIEAIRSGEILRMSIPGAWFGTALTSGWQTPIAARSFRQ